MCESVDGTVDRGGKEDERELQSVNTGVNVLDDEDLVSATVAGRLKGDVNGETLAEELDAKTERTASQPPLTVMGSKEEGQTRRDRSP